MSNCNEGTAHGCRHTQQRLQRLAAAFSPSPPGHRTPPLPLVYPPPIRCLHSALPAPPAMADTEGTNNATTSTSTSPLFSFSNPGASFGFGFGFDAAPTLSHPPPPPVEVLLSEVLFLPSFSFVLFFVIASKV
jgi:hypothetical protein